MAVQGVLLFSLLFISLLPFSQGTYNLVESWTGSDIFNWDFYSGSDPTHGYVYYATESQAESWGYVYVNSAGQIVIRSDDTTVSSGSGRGSVRINTPGTYTHGIFIFDVEHMPFGCGTWPAFWTANLDTWPAGGEIDILEGVNNVAQNQMTLHTSSGCTFPQDNNWDQTGNDISWDCGANSGTTGCSTVDATSTSYGSGFNANGGGVFAMQWEASGIYIWFWPRGSVPSNINSPNPAVWGTPKATWPFGNGCTDSTYFYNHHIIIDNTFCGDWAGAVFGSQCGGSCSSFVQNNPSDFSQAYWVINEIAVYQQ